MQGGQDQAVVRGLVRAAAAGDGRAWDDLVRRYGGAIRSVTRGHRLSDADADDVAQTTWLRLLRSIDRLEDPAAVGAWLVTTARRESLRVLQGRTREFPTDEPALLDEPDPASVEERVAEDERREALRRAVRELPARPRALLELLLASPDPSYAEVGAALGIPVGSIGPTRERSLARLRRDPRVLALAA
jgi:RNA polymerase sigma factor (sigma-70 family)